VIQVYVPKFMGQSFEFKNRTRRMIWCLIGRRPRPVQQSPVAVGAVPYIPKARDGLQKEMWDLRSNCIWMCKVIPFERRKSRD